jgi:hypothetical protein
MPHLLKEYSKNLGVNPSKPVVNRHFYPVEPEKYIVIYNEQEIQSKKYEYYKITIGLIKGVLESNGYKVVVIGSEKNLIEGADYYYPNLSFRKNCYIVSKASAFISIDNALTQYAGSCGIPVVNLYGNIYSSITTPYWLKDNKKIDLEPVWDKKPCLGLIDPKESINKINPEDVASSILKLIGFKLDQEINFKSKRRNKTKHFQLDVIPTKYVRSPIFDRNVLNIRLDQGVVDEEALFLYCSNHTCNIITKDTLLEPKTLQKISGNLKRLIFTVTTIPEKIPDSYFEYLKKLDIEILFLVTNKNIIDDIRLEYFNSNVEYIELTKEKPSDVDLNDKFISFKIVVEGDKSYSSLAHWKKRLDSNNNILDNPSYWEELDYFYIYEQDTNS